MQVTVITVCRNSAGTIRHTIGSVLSQDHPDIRYIVIDGGSADGTADIVQSYGDRIAAFVSEPDDGMYFAINKGLALATGEVVGILHADDVYENRSVLSRVAETFIRTGAGCVYGDLVYVDRRDTGKVVRRWTSGAYRQGLFRKGWMPPHPAFFVRRDMIGKYGAYDTRFVLAADYEFMLRLLHRFRVPAAYLPEVLVRMRAGGKSNVSLANRLRANLEDRKAWRVNGLRPGLLTLTLKPLRKLGQFGP